jgi:hypothetical protein
LTAVKAMNEETPLSGYREKPPAFIPGIELSHLYYLDAVAPILAQDFPHLPHSAALVGYGSDTIRFDDERSRDHMWGPRMVLFLPEEDFPKNRLGVDTALRENLPVTFHGYSTSFGPPNPDDNGVRHVQGLEHGPVDHLIEITHLPAYFQKEIGWDTQRPIETADWLTFSEHRLLTLTSGGVWHDDLGLETLRARLAYYPRPVWMYLLASQWARIGQEEPFVGRTVEAGDETGSRILTAKMVQAVMGLAFLLERRYTPYSKWFGTAFKRLELAAQLQPHLDAALAAPDYASREQALSCAYEMCAQQFNALGLIPAVPEQVSLFYDRPFHVIHGGEIATRLFRAIEDPAIQHIPALIGSVNQFSSSTDLLESVLLCQKAKSFYACPDN